MLSVVGYRQEKVRAIRKMDTTQDYLLKGAVHLRQLRMGYRAGIDPVYLAAACNAGPGERVLDVGAGVGAASLCLAVRVPGCLVSALEREETLVTLLRQNACDTGVEARVEGFCDDLFGLSNFPKAPCFDHVMTNPPFMEAGHTPPPNTLKMKAHHEDAHQNVEGWLKACLCLLKDRGTFTMIHRTDRLDQIMAFLWRRVGGICLYPILSKAGGPCKRFLLTGRKGVKTPLQNIFPLIVHEDDGTYTAQAREILENKKGLEELLTAGLR